MFGDVKTFIFYLIHYDPWLQKMARKSGNVLGMFPQSQIQEFKEVWKPYKPAFVANFTHSVYGQPAITYVLYCLHTTYLLSKSVNLRYLPTCATTTHLVAGVGRRRFRLTNCYTSAVVTITSAWSLSVAVYRCCLCIHTPRVCRKWLRREQLTSWGCFPKPKYKNSKRFGVIPCHPIPVLALLLLGSFFQLCKCR